MLWGDVCGSREGSQCGSEPRVEVVIGDNEVYVYAPLSDAGASKTSKDAYYSPLYISSYGSAMPLTAPLYKTSIVLLAATAAAMALSSPHVL